MEEFDQEKKESPISIGDWMITMLLMCIPLINLIMLFVWAFGSNYSPSKSNWAKASLVWMLIGILICSLFWSSLTALLTSIN